jgi:ribosomal-protein-alanine N-acetyltransferase
MTELPSPITLETQRLVFRRLVPGDLDALAALYADPEVRRYFPEGTLTRAQTADELAHFANGHPLDPRCGLWATLLKDTGEFVGRCGLLLYDMDGRREYEVAYTIARAHWGRGLATEAARGVRDYGFHGLGLERLICLVDGGNAASIRVATKIGMAFERTGRDELGPYHLYSMRRTEPLRWPAG